MKIVRLVYLLLGVSSVLIAAYILVVKVRKVSVAAITCLLCVAFMVAVNFIVIMCPETWIYTLMVYSFVLVACVPLMMLELLPDMDGFLGLEKKVLTNGIALIISLLIFCYAYETNICYSSLYFANRQVENYLSSMVAQIRMTEGFDAEKKWAFLGDIVDPLLNSDWQYETRYGGNEFTIWLLNRYSRYAWLQNYIGYLPPSLSDEEIEALSKTEEVLAMPCWPSHGSIKVIDDTVVVKFQDLTTTTFQFD